MNQADPHGPNRLSNYLETHETILRRFVDSGFVTHNTLVTTIGATEVRIEGTLECAGDIRLDVEKTLAVLEGEGLNALVQTVFYRYNASLPIGNILRCDSPHADHNQFHHVHRFDVFEGDVFGTISEGEWPTLGEAIQELQDWYYRNLERLYPSEVPESDDGSG